MQTATTKVRLWRRGETANTSGFHPDITGFDPLRRHQ